MSFSLTMPVTDIVFRHQAVTITFYFASSISISYLSRSPISPISENLAFYSKFFHIWLARGLISPTYLLPIFLEYGFWHSDDNSSNAICAIGIL